MYRLQASLHRLNALCKAKAFSTRSFSSYKSLQQHLVEWHLDLLVLQHKRLYCATFAGMPFLWHGLNQHTAVHVLTRRPSWQPYPLLEVNAACMALEHVQAKDELRPTLLLKHGYGACDIVASNLQGRLYSKHSQISDAYAFQVPTKWSCGLQAWQM